MKHIKLTLALILIPLATNTLLHGGENPSISPIEKLRQAASPNEQPASPEFTTPPETIAQLQKTALTAETATQTDLSTAPKLDNSDSDENDAVDILGKKKKPKDKKNKDKDERTILSILNKYAVDSVEWACNNPLQAFIAASTVILTIARIYNKNKPDGAPTIPTAPIKEARDAAKDAPSGCFGQ